MAGSAMGIVSVAVGPSAAVGGGGGRSRPPDGELRGRLRATEPRWGGGAAGDCDQSGDLPERGFDGELNGPCGRNRRPVVEEQCCRMASASRGIIPEGCATGRRARQDTEHDHGATAGRATIGPMRRDVLDLFGGRFLRWRVEQLATEREVGGALAVREEAVVADAMSPTPPMISIGYDEKMELPNIPPLMARWSGMVND